MDLYHNLQGGVIAQQRPPPPGANDPYLNLGSIPPRPPAPDIAAQQRVGDQLAAQRDAAQRAAAASPLPAAPPPAPAPAKPAAPDPNANRVVVDAAPAPAALPAPVASAPAGIDAVPPVPQSITSGPLPTFAAAPPPFPVGVALSIPIPPPTPPTPAAPPTPPAPANTVVVAFTPGSATLPPSANLNLRRFALAHKGVALTAIGHGEAVLAPPDAQASALDLALHRAQAIAAALADAGVPASNLHLRAEATGQGGAATL